MQDCWNHAQGEPTGHLVIRWCEDHETWVVYAWAKAGDGQPFQPVHPMWLRPRTVLADEHANGTLLQLLTAVQRTVQRLSHESRSGQLPLEIDPSFPSD